jgi:hypothetical protein
MAPQPLNFTQTNITLASSTPTLFIGRSNTRSYLMIQATSTAPATISFSSAVAVGAGIGLDPAIALGGQGGSVEWVAAVPLGPVYAIANSSIASLTAIQGF